MGIFGGHPVQIYYRNASYYRPKCREPELLTFTQATLYFPLVYLALLFLPTIVYVLFISWRKYGIKKIFHRVFSIFASECFLCLYCLIMITYSFLPGIWSMLAHQMFLFGSALCFQSVVVHRFQLKQIYINILSKHTVSDNIISGL